MNKNNHSISELSVNVDLKEQIDQKDLQNRQLESDNFILSETENYWHSEYDKLRSKYNKLKSMITLETGQYFTDEEHHKIIGYRDIIGSKFK